MRHSKIFFLRIPELGLLIGLTVLGFSLDIIFSHIKSTEMLGDTAVIIIMIVSFLFSTMIAIVSVIGGVGGGVIFTPVMLGFTSIDSLIVRATGLVVSIVSGLIRSGPLLRHGLADIKLVFFGAIPMILGSLLGGYTAVHLADRLGSTGDALVRLLLGILIMAIAILFTLAGKRSEYPQNEIAGPLARFIGLGGTYWDDSLAQDVEYKIRRGRYGLIILLFVGFIGGFFGIGGGIFVVPIYNLLMFVPLKLSAGCSGILLALGNATAIWPYLMAGALIPLFVAPWLVGQAVGGIIGANLLKKIRAGFVRNLLIALLFLAGLKLIIRGIEGLSSMNIPVF